MKDNRVIILAAGQGTRLRPYTDEIPKCMIPLHGKPILHWQLDTIRSCGITDIVVVEGYRNEKVYAPGTKTVVNREFNTTNMVESLWCARDYFDNGFIMCYGDIVYNAEVLENLLESTGEISVVVDKAWKPYWSCRTENILNDIESLSIGDTGKIKSIGQKVDSLKPVEGQYIGMVAFRQEGVRRLRKFIERTPASNLYMTDLLQGLINEGVSVDPVWINGGWLEIDTIKDLEVSQSRSFVKDQHLLIRSYPK
jgi:choline kinase